MLYRWMTAVVRGLGPALCLWLSPFSFGFAATDTPVVSPDRQQQLVLLVRNDCGSCHGMTLKGGLGSPLTPEALADKPDASLRETILRGRTGTAMPGWSDFMTEAEAQWIVEQLKAGFPNAR